MVVGMPGIRVLLGSYSSKHNTMQRKYGGWYVQYQGVLVGSYPFRNNTMQRKYRGWYAQYQGCLWVATPLKLIKCS